MDRLERSYALLEVCRKGDIEAARTLLEQGALAGTPDVLSGHRPLNYAVSQRNVELVRLLVAYGAQVDTPALRFLGMTPLQQAALQGDQAMMTCLLELGATVPADLMEFVQEGLGDHDDKDNDTVRFVEALLTSRKT
ncbi:MAG: ankyrin repeat domain-containing protein [Myxococcota bacterium]